MSALAAEHVRVIAAGRAASVAVYRARQPRVGTLVFVHGAGCDHHVAEPLAAQLADFDVIAPDLPGRVGTPGAPCTSVAEAATFVGGVLDALALPRAIALGHSYGGGIALELALTRPLAGLVLASTGARLRVLASVLEMMRAQAASSTESVGLVGWSAGADPSLVARLDASARAVPAATSLADWLAADAFDRMGMLEALRVPTLVLAGETDLLTPPKYARYLGAHIAGAQLEVLPAAGHLLPIDQADRVAPFVRVFAHGTR